MVVKWHRGSRSGETRGVTLAGGCAKVEETIAFNSGMEPGAAKALKFEVLASRGDKTRTIGVASLDLAPLASDLRSIPQRFELPLEAKRSSAGAGAGSLSVGSYRPPMSSSFCFSSLCH